MAREKFFSQGFVPVLFFSEGGRTERANPPIYDGSNGLNGSEIAVFPSCEALQRAGAFLRGLYFNLLGVGQIEA